MMNDPKDPFYVTRSKIFMWGLAATAIIIALVFLYVPKAPKNNAQSAPLQGPGSDSSLLVPDDAGNLNAPNATDASDASDASGVASAPAGPAASGEPVVYTADVAALAQQNYVKYCAQCHGPDGKAGGQMARMMTLKPTNLAEGPFKYARTAEGITAIIMNGVGTMPKFGNELGATGAAQVAEYTLRLEKK